MSSPYVLSCCSTVDLSKEHLQARDIAYLFMEYELDGVACKDDFGATHAPKDLYARMLAGSSASTTQVSVGGYMEHWRPFLEAGRDVLHVTLSSGISGTYGSACTARDQLAAEFPDRTIRVVDSLCASAGYGLLLDRMADLRDEGMGIDELADWAEVHRQNVQHWFFSSDLTFFVRGGRISKASGVVGGLLKICPLMYVAPDGSLKVVENIRTKRKAEKRVRDLMTELADGGAGYTGKVYMSDSDCRDDANDLAALIEEAIPGIEGGVQHFDIGATIGTHTGPGTIATFWWGSPRE